MLRISFDFVPYGTSTSTYHIIIYNKNKNEKCSMFTKMFNSENVQCLEAISLPNSLKIVTD